ncbi:MAG TPA: 16S rRNA processing protein RimM [Desulfobulbaceae bacterium]|nr:MAG: 16S rRNA processing protein RimM [Deltaproteobacteria bacterium RIFOXYD12_FULL_53_23]HCC53537.1 16S rRNA processing protein RimM [Desulfobulbaceae bacterium]
MKILDVGVAYGGQIAVGKVAKAHGIKGELKVYPFSGRPDDFCDYRLLTLIGPDKGLSRSYEVDHCRPLENLVLLQLAGLSGRSAAEGLRGWEVRIARELLPTLGEGIFYWHELAGLPVISEAGQALGRITSLLATDAHDILVITGAGSEYLIPVVDECVAGLASDGKALIVTPPPGLLEMNAGGVLAYAS